MKDRGSFLEHYKKIKVEGFEQQKLLTQCIKSGIVLRNIYIINDIEMTMTIMDWDYNKFLKLIKNRYQVTILYENGYKPIFKKIVRKKSTIAGLILFALIMYYQSSFVSEIRVMGYQTFTETAIRESLREAGFYEGCSKSVDINNVKLHIYQDLDNIAWVGVKYIGNMAEVTIIEGAITPPPVDITKPCHIVATKNGYVEKVIAKEGKIALDNGVYVKAGDILITGIVPVTSTAYGTSESDITERYVHASGEVYAKVPYRLSYYLDKYCLLKEPTGRKIHGISFEFGDFKINTGKLLNNYESSNYSEKKLIKFLRPIPVYLGLSKIEEITLSRQERSKTDIKKATDLLVREAIREKVPEKAQILNKSLKFSSEENIIEVGIILETLEEIGKEKEIVIGEPTD